MYGFVLIDDPFITPQQLAERAQHEWDTGDNGCLAPDGYADIVAGGEVQVLGADGVIARGVVEAGEFNSDAMVANDIVGCGFPIVIEGVPQGLDVYGLHVGGELRPAFSFTASEMRSGPRLIFG
ncbi:hypothetical protein [Herbiconiux sp. A18JL235]|uniref:Uncharacterized protein n=1 Tax=Herbiconiux sp. A18JL235 TaxID=3152363 RepID=A0AB39BEC6_9MICO